MESTDVKKLQDIDECESPASVGGPKFVPVLYIQRYGFIRSVLHQHNIKSMVDFGSAQCKILTLLKTVKSLERINLVDLDKHLLEANIAAIKPLIYDFLQPRERPLTVRLYHGDATQLDTRLLGCEAVTMVEFIEHLESSDLEKVVAVVFGELQPRLVVITTPNADFNQLFPGFTGMRHWDHKFEWSRKEFQSWCSAVCDKYNYAVTYDGIGDPPTESAHLGHCSQAAIFTSIDTSSSVDIKGDYSYTLVAETAFPYEKNRLSSDDKLALEVEYCLHQLTLNSDPDEGQGYFVIPVQRLLEFRKIHELCDIKKLRSYLHSKYSLSRDEESVYVPVAESDNDDDDDDYNEEMEGYREEELSQPKGNSASCVTSNEESWD